MAPEMVQNKPHDVKIDIWSLGVLLYELVHGHAPFTGKSTDQKFSEILNKDTLTISAECSENCKDLILKLLRKDPDERPTFEEIFSHPWVKGFESLFKMKISDYVYDPTKRKRKNTQIVKDNGGSTPRNGAEKAQRSANRSNTCNLVNTTLNTTLNDTINSTALDISVVNFEPLSLKKEGNLDTSNIEKSPLCDNSPISKPGNSVLYELNSGSKVQKTTEITKSPSSRRNKFATDLIDSSSNTINVSQVESSFDTRNLVGGDTTAKSPRPQIARDDRTQKLLQEIESRIKGNVKDVQVANGSMNTLNTSTTELNKSFESKLNLHQQLKSPFAQTSGETNSGSLTSSQGDKQSKNIEEIIEESQTQEISVRVSQTPKGKSELDNSFEKGKSPDRVVGKEITSGLKDASNMSKSVDQEQMQGKIKAANEKALNEIEDEIPNESIQKENKPRKSDISEKQTKSSVSPARRTSKAEAKGDDDRRSRISDYQQQIKELSANRQKGHDLLPEGLETINSPEKTKIKGFSVKEASKFEAIESENRATHHERITNLDKYIQDCLEDNEELQILSKLEELSTPLPKKQPKEAKEAKKDSPDSSHLEKKKDDVEANDRNSSHQFSFGKKQLEEVLGHKIPQEYATTDNSNVTAVKNLEAKEKSSEISQVIRKDQPQEECTQYSDVAVKKPNVNGIDTGNQGEEVKLQEENNGRKQVKKQRRLISEIRSDSSSDEEERQKKKKSGISASKTDITKGYTGNHNTSQRNVKNEYREDMRGHGKTANVQYGSQTSRPQENRTMLLPNSARGMQSSKDAIISNNQPSQIKQYDYKGAGQKDKEMTREDLMKFYQTQMNQLESSVIGGYDEGYDEGYEGGEEVLTYEINNKQINNALKNRNQAKKASGYAGSTLFS